MKLRTRIWLVSSLLVVVMIGGDYVISRKLLDERINAELKDDAKEVQAMLMAMRRVYQQQFIDSGLPLDDKMLGFLPAHAISRISADFPNWSRSGLSFNNVSDRPRNPRNQADAHELEAMAYFRANPEAEEHLAEIRDAAGKPFFHFTAPIWIEKSCLKCHGERDQAPESIAGKYDSAYGYRLGDLRGVVSIKVPASAVREHWRQVFVQRFSLSIAGYGVLLLLIGFSMEYMVTRRVARVEGAAKRLSDGDYSARCDMREGDEIASLGVVFDHMGEHIQADIAALNHAREEVDRLNEKLELRVQEEVAKNRDKDHLLIQQSRLASMGEMIRNISHHWRQPLNALAVLLANVKDAHDFGELDSRVLDKLMSDGNRFIQQMSGTIDDFRHFFRTDAAPCAFDAAKAVEEALAIMDASLKDARIEVRKDISAGVRVFGYPGQFAQVLLNILANAKEGIQQNRSGAGRITVGLHSEDNEAVLTITDNGGGIPVDILPRVFDPYFTTKAQGSGIGLFMTKMILERNMNGRIMISSHEGETVVKVILPLAETETLSVS